METVSYGSAGIFVRSGKNNSEFSCYPRASQWAQVFE